MLVGKTGGGRTGLSWVVGLWEEGSALWDSRVVSGLFLSERRRGPALGCTAVREERV